MAVGGSVAFGQRGRGRGARPLLGTVLGAALGAAAVLALVAACGGNSVLPPSGGGTSPAAATAGPVTLGSDLAPARLLATFTEPVAPELVPDPLTGGVWVATQSAQPGHAELLRVDPAGTVTRYPLPGDFGPTATGHVKRSPDGAIWVTSGYSLARLDPRTGALTSRTLPVTDPNAGVAARTAATALPATPTATSTATPTAAPPAAPPGTWIAGLTFDATADAVLLRANVDSLELFDGSLIPVGVVRLAAGSPVPPTEIVLTGSGVRLYLPGSGAPVILPLSGLPGLGPPGRLAGLVRTSTGPDVLAVEDLADGATVRAAQRTADLVESRASGTQRYLLPTREVPVHAPPGGPVDMFMLPPTIMALAPARDRGVWFVAQWRDTTGLYLVQP